MTRSWPPYQTCAPLLHAHRGRAAVIVGGGDSIKTSLPKCPADAIYIGVNDHGLRYLKDHPELGRRIELVVACDKIEERARADIGLPGMKRDRQPWGLPVVSRHCWGDYRLLKMPGTCSGMAAAWVARFMGCAPVILTGMDLYSGGRAYHDAPKAKSSGFHVTDLEHLSRWWQFAQQYPYQYLTLDCHPGLGERLGRWKPGTKGQAPTPAERLEAELHISRIRLGRDTVIDMRPFKAGEVIPVSRVEAQNLVKRKQAALV